MTVRERRSWNADMLFTSDGDWLIEIYEEVNVGKECRRVKATSTFQGATEREAGLDRWMKLDRSTLVQLT